jgi:hypothetical protein
VSRSARSRPPALAALLCVGLLAGAPPDPVSSHEGPGQESQDLQALAADAVQASDWSTAATLYARIVEAEPQNAAAWYRLGLTTVRSGGDTEAARRAFETSGELGFAPPAVQIGLASSHAVDGDHEAVFAILEELAQQGPSSFVISQLGSDPSFATLASQPRFQDLVTLLTPCATDEYRQFDFWLGKWHVVSPQGQPLGTNTITESLDGCMLIESWESASGGQKGMSINYYDRVEGNWTQIFRDNSGNIAQWPTLTGGVVGDAMVLESPADAEPRTRWTWTEEADGRVRQMAESSSDGGVTWTTIWDSYYERAD